MTKIKERFKEDVEEEPTEIEPNKEPIEIEPEEEPIEVEPEEEPIEIEPIEIEPEEEPIEIEPIEEEPIEIEPEEEPIEIEPIEEEPIEIEPEEEPIEIEPEEEPIEIEPIEEEPLEEEPIEEEPIEIEPEEEPVGIKPIEEEPIEIEPIEEEPIEIEPIEEEPLEEEPIEEELVEEPIEDEPIEEEPYEEPVEEEPFEEEPYEEPFEEEETPVEKHYEEAPFEEEPYEETGLSKETAEEPFEIPYKKVPYKQEYQRTLTKPANYHENLKACKSRQLQDLDKNRVSGSSVPLGKNQSRVWYKRDRPGLSQARGSKGEIDMTNLYICNFPQSLNCEDLKNLFSKFGPIAKIYVAMDNDSGLNNGHGFVKFNNAAHAAMAIDQMNGHTIIGMPMKVKIKGVKPETGTSMLGQGSPGREVLNKTKLFVEHLPLDVTRIGLIKMFQKFGTIASAYLVKGKSRLSKVYGYVIFSNVASAAQAMADMNGLKIGANKLHVTIASDTHNAKENRSSQPTHALPCPDHVHVRKKASRPPEYDYTGDRKNYEDDEDLPGYRKRYRRQ